MSTTNRPKPLKDLNLLDRFLFAEAMEDPVIMQDVLEILLGEEIILKYPPQTEEVSQMCKSERIKDLQKRIEIIKSNEEVGVRYMQAWEEKVLGEKKAREEGLQEGRKEGRKEITRLNRLYAELLDLNRTEDLKKAIEDEESLKILYKEFRIYDPEDE